MNDARLDIAIVALAHIAKMSYSVPALIANKALEKIGQMTPKGCSECKKKRQAKK